MRITGQHSSAGMTENTGMSERIDSNCQRLHQYAGAARANKEYVLGTFCQQLPHRLSIGRRAPRTGLNP